MSLRRFRSSVRWILAGAVIASLAPLVAAQPAIAGVPSCAAAGIGLESLGGPNFYIDAGNSPDFTSSYTGYRVTNSTGDALSDTWVSLSEFTGGALGLGSGQAAAEQIASLGDGSSAPLFWYLTASGETATAQGFTITVYQHNPALPNTSVLCTKTSGFNQVIGTIAANPNTVDGITVQGGTPTLGSTFTVTVTGNTGQMGSGPADDSDPYSLWMSPAVAAEWPPSAFRLIATNLHIAPDTESSAMDFPNILRIADLGPAERDYTATYVFQAIGFTDGPTAVLPVQEISSGTQVKHTGAYPIELPAIEAPTNSVYLDLSAAPTQLDPTGGQVSYTGTVHGTEGISLDSFTVTPPPGATFVTGSANLDGVSMPDPVESDGKLVFSGPFTLTSDSIPLDFELVLPATPGDLVTSFVAGLGSAVIGTDPEDVSGETPATATVAVGTPPPPELLPQTITVTQPESVGALSGPVTLDGAAGSELPVSYESLTPQVCSVDAETGVVTLLAAGTCTIRLTQEGDETYQPADPVDVSFEIQTAAQTIEFHAARRLLTGPAAYTLTATTSAELPVTFSVARGPDVCAVVGDQLSFTGTGRCVIKASSPASGLYGRATPVRRTINVVAPAGDAVSLPPTTGQQAPHVIDVLANDPSGLTLVSAGPAGHGSTAVSNGHVVYTPEVTFRGVDHFTYTVSDDSGRIASALVTVHLANTAPTARNETLRQVAGSAAEVRVHASDPNADPLTMTVVRHPAHVVVAVSGRTLTVRPAASVTGRIAMTVAVHDGAGGNARAQIVDLVRPQPVDHAQRTIDQHGTHISWSKAAAAGAVYEVRVNGHLICTTRRLGCDAAQLLGPGLAVTVTVRGNDGTRSADTPATPQHGKVLVGTVYFASSIWTLDATHRAYLRQLAHQIRRNGFRNVQLAGYTDSRGSLEYNLHLSHQRTATVARILHHRTGLRSSQSWYGEKHPAVSGAAAARNRRVEIYVSY